ncbi:MAG TPA: PEGA domain-containing protein [Bacteroidota bacterium]|nr:PEGA domain-containing protein [Bacteroidota bacterium]
MKIIALQWLFFVLCTPFALAQDEREARLTIQSNPTAAEVFVNGNFIGTTPLDRVAVTAGKVLLRVVYPSAKAWNALERTDTLTLQPGQEFLRDVDLGGVFSLVSVPSGATVFRDSQELGRTPLFWRGAAPVGELRLRKEAYEEVTLSLPTEGSVVRLKPTTTDIPPEVLTSEMVNGGNNRIPVYAAATAMIVSGVIAAYLKDQADREFDAYVQTALPRHRETTRRLDRQAGISFVVAQVSFGALAYLLLTE